MTWGKEQGRHGSVEQGAGQDGDKDLYILPKQQLTKLIGIQGVNYVRVEKFPYLHMANLLIARLLGVRFLLVWSRVRRQVVHKIQHNYEGHSGFALHVLKSPLSH